MKRWSRAFPGVIKVTHTLGNFKTEALAYAAYQAKILPLVADLPQDQVHPRLRCAGYGSERTFWGEFHFATAALGEQHLQEHGGQPWYCVGLYGEAETKSSAEAIVKDWLKGHVETAGMSHIKSDIIDNHGENLLADEETPGTYVYLDNADAAVMLKLALGGRA